jgi:hypothetical protein
MNARRGWAVAWLCGAAAAGCAGQAPSLTGRPFPRDPLLGQPASRVLAIHGIPDLTERRVDGSEVWTYRPAPSEEIIVTIGPDGTVRRILAPDRRPL